MPQLRDRWSWLDVVRYADRLGIPHFQRGAVWETGNRTALLESIYEKSPCGAFVLWAPPADDRDRFRHGKALRSFHPDKQPLWLVDGQQRTRALLGTYEELLLRPQRSDGWSLVRDTDWAELRERAGALLRHTHARSEVTEGESETVGAPDPGELNTDEPAVWFVVLPAMSVFERQGNAYFGKLSESKNVHRGSMFRRLRPRTRMVEGRPRPGPPLSAGLIPLASLIAPTSVFQDPTARAAVATALATFDADDSAVRTLDALLPWGPQFLTGHAYTFSGPSGVDPTPMDWTHVHRRRTEDGIRFLLERLGGLFDAVAWGAVFEGFQRMLDGEWFAVGALPESDVSAAIDAYVRINRAGVRVRAEERALAVLSRARPELLQDLNDYIAGRDGSDTVEDPRTLLTHESDRQMGFEVWMATVTRYVALALLGDSARQWLGVAAIDKSNFTYRLDRVGRRDESDVGKGTWARADYAGPGELIRECAERASQALVLIDGVLSDALYLDHRTARPSARALTPLIDLLYRVPASCIGRLGADTSFRAALARVLHWTLLAPYIDQPALEKLVADLHELDEGKTERSPRLGCWDGDADAIDQKVRVALRTYLKSLLDAWLAKQDSPPAAVGTSPPRVTEHLTRLASANFARLVGESRSLRHPAVGWLYAVERRNDAQEFCWEAQLEGYNDQRYAKKVGVPEDLRDLTTREDLYPEKQHIVPFVFAKRIVGGTATRATASPSNELGNLTWLSARQNGLEGLADQWTVMDRARDLRNLDARGMLAPAEGHGAARDALDLYDVLRARVLAGEKSGSIVEQLYFGMCDARERWLIAQMDAWLVEPLPPEAAAWIQEPA